MMEEVHLEVVLFNKFRQIVSFIATLLSSKKLITHPLSLEFRGEDDVYVNSKIAKQ
jgi:hypothetical protein